MHHVHIAFSHVYKYGYQITRESYAHPKSFIPTQRSKSYLFCCAVDPALKSLYFGGAAFPNPTG